MKLIKIKNDYYLVDNTEIQKGDWFYNPHLKEIHPATHPPYTSDMLKIISSTFRDAYGQIPTGLDLQEVKELIGEVDVEKKAHNWFMTEKFMSSHIADMKSFIAGYNQALEDNKEKKYTEAQMRECWRASERFDRPYNEGYAPNFEEFIQSLQPKTEWEVEIVDGKLKLL